MIKFKSYQDNRIYYLLYILLFIIYIFFWFTGNGIQKKIDVVTVRGQNSNLREDESSEESEDESTSSAAPQVNVVQPLTPVARVGSRLSRSRLSSYRRELLLSPELPDLYIISEPEFDT